MKISFPFLKKIFHPVDDQVEDEALGQIRKDITQNIFLVASIVGTLAYFGVVYKNIQNGDWVMLASSSIAYVSVVILVLYRKVNYRARAWVMILLLFMLALADLHKAGLAGEGRLFLTVMVIMAMTLLEYRHGIRFFILATLAMVTIAALMITGVIPAPTPESIDDSSQLGDWLVGGALFVLLTGLAVSSMYAIINGLDKALLKQRHMAGELMIERGLMEQRVAERTAQIEEQNRRLETISTFARSLSPLNVKKDVLNQAASYINEKLGYENLVIWLADEDSDMYIAEKHTGDMGKSLADQMRRIPVNQPASISEVMASSGPRLLRNSSEDARYFKGQALAQIPAVLVVPFHTDEHTQGAVMLLLDKDASFFAKDFELFSAIADRTGVYLQKARLTEMLAANLEEAKASSRHLTQQSWRSYLKARSRSYSLKYSHGQIHPGASQTAEAAEALKAGKLVIETLAPEDGGQPVTSVAVPILLRGEPLGVINLRFAAQSVPEDLVALIEAVTKRLALSLENARLMEEMKQRAEREHAVSNIASKVRASSDIDGILKSAAQEIGRSLGVSEVLVQLRSDK